MPLWDTIDFAAYIVNILLSGLFASLCLRRAGSKEPDSDKSLRAYLLAGVFACVCLADLFYVLAWLILDYPDPFSAADLSWMGGYVFLIAADMHLIHGLTAAERETANRYKILALTAPFLIVAFRVIDILLFPDAIFNYVFSGIPMGICAYYTMWILLCTRKGVARQTRRLHLFMALFITADLLYVLFCTLGWESFAIPATFSGELYVASVIGMFISIRKEPLL